MIFATPRLIARRFRPGDLADFVAMRNDPEVSRYQSWEGYDAEDGRRFIASLENCEPGEPGWFQFALEEKETGRFIGERQHQPGRAAETSARRHRQGSPVGAALDCLER